VFSSFISLSEKHIINVGQIHSRENPMIKQKEINKYLEAIHDLEDSERVYNRIKANLTKRMEKRESQERGSLLLIFSQWPRTDVRYKQVLIALTKSIKKIIGQEHPKTAELLLKIMSLTKKFSSTSEQSSLSVEH
jgi:transcription initiation factor TFIID subunit TAF12